MAEQEPLKLPETIDEYLKIPESLKEKLSTISWKEAPMVNYTPLKYLRNEQLVRFRGMIQDMHSPELYMQSAEVLNETAPEKNRLVNCKYRDNVPLEKNETVSFKSYDYDDRRKIVVVGVPAYNSWAMTHDEKWHEAKIEELSKELNNINVKEQAESAEDGELPNKRIRTEIEDLTSPIKDRPSKVCMVKLYKDFDKYKLCSMVEVLGFLHKPADEERAMNDPPEVHAIELQELLHNNPLLDPYASSCEELDDEVTLSNMADVQKELLKFLSICLFDDEIAAKHLLCNLVSAV